MKKLLMLVLGLSLVFTLAACQNDDGEIDIPKDITDLTPEEIADKLKDEFDNDLSHLDTAMENMDFSDGYEMTMEGAVILSANGNTINAFVSMSDKMMMNGEYLVYSRTQEMSMDGMSFKVEMIMEEAADGMNVYFNLGGLLSSLPNEAVAEVEKQLDAFAINEDWLMFHFEDSLENVAELEGLKDFILYIVKDELGSNAYNDLQTELETEAGFDLDQYGVSIPELAALLEANDYDGLRTVIEAIDFEGLQAEVADEVEYNNMIIDPMALEAVLAGVDVEALHTELETFDFKMVLDKVALGEAEYTAYVNTLGADYPEMQSILEAYTPIVELLEAEDMLAEVGYVANNIDTFDPYFDLQTYLDEEFVTIGVEVVNTTNLLTTLTLYPENLHGLFQDFVTDFYWFMYSFPGSDIGFLEHVNCPSGQYCDDFDIYTEIESELQGVDPITVEVLYEPGDNEAMSITVDAVDFVESVAQKQGEVVVVQKFEMTMGMKEGATITIPSGAVNVRNTLVEAMQIQFIEDVRWQMSYLYERVEWEGLDYDVTYALSDLDTWLLDNPAYDQDMSNITMLSSGEVELNLYWRDGTAVFADTLLMSELDDFTDEFHYNPTRQAVLDQIGLFNAETFEVGKLLAYLLMD